MQGTLKFVPIVGHRNKIGIKFTVFSEFGPLRVNIWYHTFSSIKLEEYIESELSDIFRVKLVDTKQ